MSDNGSDERPRVYMRASTPDGEVEVTVQGAKGESTADVKDVAENRFDHAVDRQGDLVEDEPDGKGVQ